MMRESDVVGRIGGDEFLIFMKYYLAGSGRAEGCGSDGNVPPSV